MVGEAALALSRKKVFGDLGNLAIDELLDLRDRIENLIGQRVPSEKLELRRKLARIAQYERRFPATLVRSTAPKGTRRIPPKYIEPESGPSVASKKQYHQF